MAFEAVLSLQNITVTPGGFVASKVFVLGTAGTAPAIGTTPQVPRAIQAGTGCATPGATCIAQKLAPVLVGVLGVGFLGFPP